MVKSGGRAGPERATHVGHQRFLLARFSPLRNLRPSWVASANLGTAARCPRPPSTHDGRRFQMHAATARIPQGAGRQAKNYADASATHVSQPTYLPVKRCAARPSTPKGVGREAPLTAARRSAKSLGRSAGQGTSGNPSGGGRECGRTCGFGVHSLLAWSCGCGRPSAADHAHTPLEKETSGVRSWSAAEGLMGPGERDGCERGAAGYRRGSGDCGGGDEGKTKAGRSGDGLRLGVGWWS